MIGCPKFDDADDYVRKFAEIFKNADIKTVTVAEMEVPCCSKLPIIVRKAMEISGKNIPMEEVVIGIRGEVLKKDSARSIIFLLGGVPARCVPSSLR